MGQDFMDMPETYDFFFFAIAIDLNNHLKQVKLPISLYTCAPISWLPSNIRTIVCNVVRINENKHGPVLSKFIEVHGLTVGVFYAYII